MAMSLSADDEDYDSDSEQVSTLADALQACSPRLLEECLVFTLCGASQSSEEIELL